MVIKAYECTVCGSGADFLGRMVCLNNLLPPGEVRRYLPEGERNSILCIGFRPGEPIKFENPDGVDVNLFSYEKMKNECIRILIEEGVILEEKSLGKTLKYYYKEANKGPFNEGRKIREDERIVTEEITEDLETPEDLELYNKLYGTSEVPDETEENRPSFL